MIMKKYLLLCLVAGTTLLASMQTYAYICLPFGLSPVTYAICMANCVVINSNKPAKYCI